MRPVRIGFIRLCSTVTHLKRITTSNNFNVDVKSCRQYFLDDNPSIREIGLYKTGPKEEWTGVS